MPVRGFVVMGEWEGRVVVPGQAAAHSLTTRGLVGQMTTPRRAAQLSVVVLVVVSTLGVVAVCWPIHRVRKSSFSWVGLSAVAV